MACETIYWTKFRATLNADLLQQNLLFFQIKLFSNQWSFCVATALSYIGKNNTFTPTLCYFDPVGSICDQVVITDMSMKIRHLLNIMWQSKSGSKVDKIESLFSKKSLPLWCPKGENTDIVCGNFSKI
jgi:hypothetical protein